MRLLYFTLTVVFTLLFLFSAAPASAGVLCGVREFTDHECRPHVWDRIDFESSSENYGGAARGGAEAARSSENYGGGREGYRSQSREYHGPDPDSSERGAIACADDPRGQRHFWNYNGRRYWHIHRMRGGETRTRLWTPFDQIQETLCQLGGLL